MIRTLDTTAQIVIEFDDEKMTEDEAILLASHLRMPTKFFTKEETLQARALTIEKLEIYDYTDTTE